MDGAKRKRSKVKKRKPTKSTSLPAPCPNTLVAAPVLLRRSYRPAVRRRASGGSSRGDVSKAKRRLVDPAEVVGAQAQLDVTSLQLHRPIRMLTWRVSLCSVSWGNPSSPPSLADMAFEALPYRLAVPHTPATLQQDGAAETDITKWHGPGGCRCLRCEILGIAKRLVPCPVIVALDIDNFGLSFFSRKAYAEVPAGVFLWVFYGKGFEDYWQINLDNTDWTAYTPPVAKQALPLFLHLLLCPATAL
eukprot:gene3770-4171_t